MVVLKINLSEVKTPLVLKNKDENKETEAEKIRFIPKEAINLFAFVFSINKEKIPVIKIVVIIVSKIPVDKDPVETVKPKPKKAEKPISPSKKRAKLPVYSLKRAPIEARINGHEKDIISKIILTPFFQKLLLYTLFLIQEQKL